MCCCQPLFPNAKNVLYTEIEEMRGSHGIQSLMFPLQVRVIKEELYRKTLEEIVRSLDKMENANIPSVSLSKREVGRTC